MADFSQILKKPKNKSLILLGKRNDAKVAALAFNEYFDEEVLSPYKREIVSELHDYINRNFKNYAKPILDVNGVVYSHFLNIFKSLEGKSENNYFKDESLEFDFSAYKDFAVPQNDFYSFVKENIFLDAIYFPNTKYLIDFVSNEEDGGFLLPKPVVKRIPFSCVFDLKEKTDNVLDYIVFKLKDEESENENKHYYLCVDSKKYQVFNEQFVLTDTIPHTLGCVPCVSASQTRLFAERTEIKSSVITGNVSDLMDYVIYKNQDAIFFRQNQTPLHFGVDSDCGEVYDDVPCENGYFVVMSVPMDSSGNKLSDEPVTKRIACASCDRKRKEEMRFGKKISFNYRDIVQKPELAKSLKDAFGFIGTDVDMLNHSNNRIKELRSGIETQIIGRAYSQGATKEAINDKQVDMANQNREETLYSFAQTVAAIETSILDLLGKARYGQSYIYSFVSYGNTFLLSTEQLYSDLSLLKSNNANQFLITEKQRQILVKETNNDFEKTMSSNVINAIIPLQDVDTLEVVKNQEAIISSLGIEKYYFRIYAAELITYFNTTIKAILFNEPAPFEDYIKKTKEEFSKYIQNQKNEL